MSTEKKNGFISDSQFLSDDENEKNPVLTFTEEDFLINIEDIKMGPKIGEGQFSTVYYATYFGDPVAVKKQTRQGKDLERYLLRELGALNNLKHKNLVEFYGACNVREGPTKRNSNDHQRRRSIINKNKRNSNDSQTRNTFTYYTGNGEENEETEEGKEENTISNATLSLTEIANSPFTDYSVYMVSAFAAGGDLLRLLLEKEEIPILGWKFRLRICMDAICGLKYLHEKGLIHRDIKSSNFLLDKNFRCVLSDFGMVRSSSNSNNTKSNRMTICGTDEYMAPELMLNENYSTPADIFSLGIVLFEIMARKQSGKGGFLIRSPRNLFGIDTEEVKEDLPEDTPESLRILATQCVDVEVENRPSTTEVFEWIEDLYKNLEEDDPTIPPPSLPKWPGLDKESHMNHQMENVTLSENTSNSHCNSITSLELSSSSISPLVLTTKNQTTTTKGSFINEKVLNTHLDNVVYDFGSTSTTFYDENSNITNETPPFYEGWLHKRKISGFRIWHRRWIVIEGGKLKASDKPGGKLLSDIYLKDHILEIESDLRVKLKHKKLHSNAPREFAASSKIDMERFCNSVEAGMKFSLAEASMRRRSSSTFESIVPHLIQTMQKGENKNLEVNNEAKSIDSKQTKNEQVFVVKNTSETTYKLIDNEMKEMKSQPYIQGRISFLVKKSKLKVLPASSTKTNELNNHSNSLNSTHTFNRNVYETTSNGRRNSNNMLDMYQVLILYRIQVSYMSEDIQKSALLYLLSDDLLEFDTKIKEFFKNSVSTNNHEERKNSNPMILMSNLPSLPDLETLSSIEYNKGASRRGSLSGFIPIPSTEEKSITDDKDKKSAILNQWDGQLELAEKEMLLQGYLNNIASLVHDEERFPCQKDAILHAIAETFQL